MPAEEIALAKDPLKRLSSAEGGLTGHEALKRLREYGPNALAKRKKRALAIEFLSHFRNPLVLILLAAGVVSVFFGQVVEAAIIFIIVLMSSSLEFYQEHKAENTAEKLRERIVTTATVLRDGGKREIRISDIVPGDVVLLSAGDIVPADCRVLRAKDFFVNESVLTGEPFPVRKAAGELKARGLPITEWVNFVFMGTSVVSGTAEAVVATTGLSTEYGKISGLLVRKAPETEFERGIRRFGYLIMQLTLLLVIFVFFVNAVFGRDLFQSFLFAIALAVGLTPELLPMIITVNLSKGALDMSRKDVIVKQLASIQNFGSMDVLCTDKTGTLTENRITLVKHIDANGKDNEKVLLYSVLNSTYQTGLKSPLDEAILAQKGTDISCYEKADEIPFDFARKRISIVVGCEGKRTLISKGATAEMLRDCADAEIKGKARKIDEGLKEKINGKFEELSEQGFRLLAVSYKPVEKKGAYSKKDEHGMTFLGFIVFFDPPKETAKQAAANLRELGVEIKILTGDNELVTKNVCGQLGIAVKGVVTGEEIGGMDDDALRVRVESANIFARITPEQKNRIMNALKANGHVVGFLGDGINDAPSLHAADVGISVNNAVDVAKESADIILMRKSLRVLHDGILEGRKTFSNVMKYIMMGNSSNFGNMFSVAGASLFLPFLPMLPIQILLNNFLYDISEATIPTDNVDREHLKKPYRWNVDHIRRFMLVFGPISSLFDFLTFFILLYVFSASAPLFQTGWFIESLATQALVIFVIRTRRAPFWKSAPGRWVALSTLAVVALGIAIPLTIFGPAFGFVALPLLFYPLLAGMIIAYLALVETVKYWFYRMWPKD